MLQKNTELLQKIKQLESELKKVKSCKRYWLVWEDKPEIFEEKAKDALPILQEDKNLRIEEDENKPNNIIIEWDNYHSLSALSYTHKWKIDVIYIDPPYNTWNKDFIYNDSFVDKEDSYRHSKWLSFMNKRLKLAKELLSKEWVILLSIDDNEQAQLKLLCDDIFGWNNFVAQIIWQKKYRPQNDAVYFSENHDYILCIAKNKKQNKNDNWWERNLMQRNEKALSSYKNHDNDPRWVWQSSWLMIEWETKNCIYEIIWPTWKVFIPKPWKRWSTNKQNFDILIKENRLWFWKEWNASPRVKRYLTEVKDWIVPSTIFLHEDSWHTGEWKTNLMNIFNKEVFTYPKPIRLIKKLLFLASQKNSTILDFFAGSWTTGHAVIDLNKEDWWNRQFILCSSRENTKNEPEKNICKNITYERNRRIIEWYTNSKWDKIEWLGWNLRYYTNEFIKADKSIDDLRYNFINMCDDLLCIKENTFTEVKLKNAVAELRLFKKWNKYTAILYDIHHFKDLVKLLEVLDWQISVYIFSLSKDIFEEELEHLNKNIIVQNIPDDILQTYKKIFNF